MYKEGLSLWFIYGFYLFCSLCPLMKATRFHPSPINLIRPKPRQYRTLLQRKEADMCLRVLKTQRTVFHDWFLTQVETPTFSLSPSIPFHTLVPFHTLWNDFFDLINVFSTSDISFLTSQKRPTSFPLVFLQHLNVFQATYEWDHFIETFQSYWNHLKPCSTSISKWNSSASLNELSCHPYMQQFHRLTSLHLVECPYITYIRFEVFQLVTATQLKYPYLTLFASSSSFNTSHFFHTWLSTLHQVSTKELDQLHQELHHLDQAFHPLHPLPPLQVASVLSNMTRQYFKLTQKLLNVQSQIQWFHLGSPAIQFFQTCVQTLLTHTFQQVHQSFAWTVSLNKAWITLKKPHPHGGICYQACLNPPQCSAEPKPKCLSIQTQSEITTAIDKLIHLERIF